MMRTTCTLTWPDGAQLVGSVETSHPTDSAPIRWTGATDRLPEIHDRLPAPTLVCLFQNLARGEARLVTEQEGNWPDESDLVS